MSGDSIVFEKVPDYLHWANSRTLASLVELPAPSNDVVDRFAHVLAAEEVWLNRLQGNVPKVSVFPKEVPVSSLQEWIVRNAEGYRRLLSTLDPKRLAESITYTASTGEPFSSVISDVLLHMTAHGCYHRGQIAVSVKALGGTPAVTDYVFYTRVAI